MEVKKAVDKGVRECKHNVFCKKNMIFLCITVEQALCSEISLSGISHQMAL